MGLESSLDLGRPPHLRSRPEKVTAGFCPAKYPSVAILALAIASSALPAAAVAAPYAYSLSGDQFVRMMSHPAELNSVQYMDREKAYSYLDGARDSGEGRVWCDVNVLKTADMAYDLAHEIAKMAPAERKKNASLLLLDLLHRKYPCRPAGGRQ